MSAARRPLCVWAAVSLSAVGKLLASPAHRSFRQAATRATPCNPVPLFINIGPMLRPGFDPVGFELLLVSDTPAASNEPDCSSAHRLSKMLTPPEIIVRNGLLVANGWPCWSAYTPARTARASRVSLRRAGLASFE